jgi:hypothetical protein
MLACSSIMPTNISILNEHVFVLASLNGVFYFNIIHNVELAVAITI